MSDPKPTDSTSTTTASTNPFASFGNSGANPFAFAFAGAAATGSTAALATSVFSSSNGAAAASTDKSEKAEDDDHDDESLEEENKTEYTPVVHLAEQSVPTGEEDDEVTYKQRAVIYRFISASQEWKERGRGDAKLLKNRKTGVIRILMRQDKILKIATNQIVHPEMELRANAGSDRSWVWKARDFSDESPADVTFAIRFQNSDLANEFKKAYDEARKANAEALLKLKDSSASSAAAPSSAQPAPAEADKTTESK